MNVKESGSLYGSRRNTRLRLIEQVLFRVMDNAG